MRWAGGVAIQPNPANAYRYLWSHFKAPNANTNLFLFQGNDLTNWSSRSVSYTPNGSDIVRDPTLFFAPKNGRLWVAHTTQNFGTAETYFDLAWAPPPSSKNGALTFTYSRTVDYSSIVSGANCNVWSPKWFQDTDGSIYNVASASNSGASDTFFAMYHTKMTADDFSTNSAPVAFTGNFPNNVIDPCFFIHNGTYYCFYKNENLSSRYIEAATASSFLGTWTVKKTGDWFGMGSGMEGIYVLPLDDGTWCCYADNEGNGYYQNRSLTSDPLGSWGTRSRITGVPYTPQNGSPIPTPLPFG